MVDGETILAFMTSDIDRERFYRTTLLVLTNRRFLSHSQVSGIQEWPIADVDKLRTKDRGGLGTLELLGHDRRLAIWHYTIAQGPSALVLGDRFDEQRAIRSPTQPLEEEDVPEAEEHEPPPDTMALLRLWQFAKPHFGWMVVAFALSMTATIATALTVMVIRNLTNLLVAFNHQETDDLSPAYFYLGLMLVAAVAAWLLGWAQGAILARVSERVTGDLRQRTYSHLQKLSLEYFGGKRTGDLGSTFKT